MMRKPVIAGNWKLFKTSTEAVELVKGLLPLVTAAKDVEIVVAPVFTVLDRVRHAISGSSVKLSAQDCFWEAEGAFTGEVSPKMLLDAGCSHVIIGHSERRQFFGETDETVNKKIKAAIASGLVVLFCIGETLAEREGGKTFDVLKRQLTGGLAGIPESDLAKVIVAYEPVWAIGTGKTASDDQAQEAHAFIRGEIKSLYGAAAAESMRILYGGSVKPENIAGLISRPDIDGALVGGASLKADSFAALVNAAQK
jgi:triosephosphate isomerase (TIM)